MPLTFVLLYLSLPFLSSVGLQTGSPPLINLPAFPPFFCLSPIVCHSHASLTLYACALYRSVQAPERPEPGERVRPAAEAARGGSVQPAGSRAPSATAATPGIEATEAAAEGFASRQCAQGQPSILSLTHFSPVPQFDSSWRASGLIR